MLRLVLIGAITLVLTLFGIANLHVVELNMVVADDVKASLAFLLLAAFILGFIIASLIGQYRAIKSRQRNRTSVRSGTPPAPVGLPPPPQLPLYTENDHPAPVRSHRR